MPQVIEMILLNARGEVLLVHDKTDHLLRDAGRWNLVSGARRPGEAVTAAVLRTVHEAVRLRPATIRRLGQQQVQGAAHHVFAGMIDTDFSDPGLTEAHELAFFPAEQALGKLELSLSARRTLSKYVSRIGSQRGSQGEDSQTTVREARAADAPALARLATQLGYPSSSQQLANRLRSLSRDSGVVLVAIQGGELVGWIHVNRHSSLLVDAPAEILGLVVGEGHRGRGIGLLLLSAAEAWAAQTGCSTMFVRSNIVRQRAHEFYTRHGYQHTKTSLTLTKPLAQSDPEPH